MMRVRDLKKGDKFVFAGNTRTFIMQGPHIGSKNYDVAGGYTYYHVREVENNVPGLGTYDKPVILLESAKIYNDIIIKEIE